MHDVCETLRTNHITTNKKQPRSPLFCSLGTDTKAQNHSDKIAYRASKGARPQMFQELSDRRLPSKIRKPLSKVCGVKMFHSSLSVFSQVTS